MWNNAYRIDVCQQQTCKFILLGFSRKNKYVISLSCDFVTSQCSERILFKIDLISTAGRNLESVNSTGASGFLPAVEMTICRPCADSVEKLLQSTNAVVDMIVL